jgi:hypothetical protein
MTPNVSRGASSLFRGEEGGPEAKPPEPADDEERAERERRHEQDLEAARRTARDWATTISPGPHLPRGPAPLEYW